ncbi:phosphotransferase [Streptomyces tendae]|uniref:phosphotransferase n=1 Tax=Streptomyces tendae TaxID=1932 RepID=UPI0036963E2F
MTAGTPPAGDQEAVCHTDLSPKNTVYGMHGGELRPTAFIDWDLAAPGARILDIAHVCWRYLDPDPAVTPDEEVGQPIRLIVDSYELSGRPESRECTMGELARPLCPDAPSLRCVAACQGHGNRRGLMTVEHRWPLDETPWPEQAGLVCGEMVELTTPHPPTPAA